MRLIDEKLIHGEVTGGSVTTDVFPNLTRTYRYHQLARRITGASSPMSMVARRRRVVVLRPSLVVAWLGKCGYGIYKP